MTTVLIEMGPVGEDITQWPAVRDAFEASLLSTIELEELIDDLQEDGTLSAGLDQPGDEQALVSTLVRISSSATT